MLSGQVGAVMWSSVASFVATLMPGLSGIDTCRQIKSAPTVRDTPLIVLTSHDGRDAMIDGLTAGADDFVSKASGRDVPSARIQAQIRRRKFADEHRHYRERVLRSEREATEARAAQELAETRAALAGELELANRELSAANRELEAFSYSVSHDLRAPLRAINGLASARETIDVSAMATELVDELVRRDPDRVVEVAVAPRLTVHADRRLFRVMLDNLLGNAWKFTARGPAAKIEIGLANGALSVRDNGVGFDRKQAEHMFRPFERRHAESEFQGTGIGLATVHRIVERHHGKIWAESGVGAGATFYVQLTAGVTDHRCPRARWSSSSASSSCRGAIRTTCPDGR